MTETGLSLGTPHYMSPEQATADKQITARSDIYSLASVLYEMLTGNPPHTGSSAQQIIMKIVTDAPRPVSELRKSVPPHVEAALLKALEKLPADRFSSAAEFGAALHDRTLTHARQALAPGGSAVSHPWLRHRASQAILAVVVLLAAWGSITTLKLTAPPAPHPLTILPFEDSTGTVTRILGNDGRWLAEGNGSRTVKLHRLDDGTAREMDFDYPGEPAASSPDGRFLLVYLFTGELKRVPVSGGTPTTVVKNAWVWQPHWGADGRIVYSDGSGLSVVHDSGGSPTRILADSQSTILEPSFLPGGRYVVYTKGTRGSPKGEIQVLDLRTHETRKLLDDGMTARYVDPGYLLYAASNRAVFAVPFDAGRARITGPPRQVMDSVVLSSSSPIAQYDVSDAGTALFRRGPRDEGDRDQTRFALVDESGREEFLPVPPGNIWGGRLTADERRLAYIRDARVYVYDLLTGLNRPVSPEGTIAASPFFWSRDEKQIFYTTFTDRVPKASAVAADGTGSAQVLAGPKALGGDLEPTSVGANDSSLLVTIWGPQSSGSRGDLGTLELGADTTYVPWLRADWNELQGALSPDGQWVAYLSDETGTSRLYVRSYPNPGKRHDVSPPGQPVSRNYLPLWARDGHAIYWSARGDSVMKADVTLRPDFSSRPARLFERKKGTTGPWDVTSNGRLLIARSPTPDSGSASAAQGPRPGRTIIMTNWLDDLRARMKGAAGKP